MRVLVVEDDAELAAILRRALVEKLFTVEIAREGESAKHLALTEDFDLIILDIMIPGIDGIAVCRALRESGKLTPVIMLTARDRVADKIFGLDAGADDYIVKPFDLGELFARIRAIRRRAESATDDVLVVGALKLDPRRTHALLGGKKVELTAKEFALLQFFMQHPDQVLSRSEILENVWDSRYEGLGNVVDVYVNYLRNKLGHSTRIETVRGRGYVLREKQ
jgi:two-component system, OmpR family, response regulator